jgi:hypothetical protein
MKTSTTALNIKTREMCQNQEDTHLLPQNSKNPQNSNKTISVKAPFTIAPKDNTLFPSHPQNKMSTKNIGEPSMNLLADKSLPSFSSNLSTLIYLASPSSYHPKAAMAESSEELSITITPDIVRSSPIIVFNDTTGLTLSRARSMQTAVSCKYQITDNLHLSNWRKSSSISPSKSKQASVSRRYLN